MTVIVISGPPGAGTSSIAKELSKKLKLDYFSPGKYYKEFHKESENQARAAAELWKTKEGSSEETHNKIDELQLQKAKEGNIVIDGKLSINMLKGYYSCSIWIDCDMKVRADRSSKRDNQDFNETLNNLKEREEQERKNWKRIYGFDYFEQRKKADIVLDTSKLNLKQTVDKLLELLKEKGIQ